MSFTKDELQQEVYQLQRENAKLRSIVRAAYLHCLDGCTPDGVTAGKRLSVEEQRQLGKDLATYGCREANNQDQQRRAPGSQP